MPRRLPLLLWTLCVTCVCDAEPNQLLLVSMDGLRWDYLSKTNTPNFKRLITQGVYATRLKGIFPTVTFPNHWSIVTGRTAEKHGIVGNSFWDPKLNRDFRMTSTEEEWWNATEPIWVTAARQNRTTATYTWPGSEAEIKGIRPKYWHAYATEVSPKVQIDTVIDWLRNESVDMAAIYFREPDSAAHSHGPDAPQTVAKVKEMDRHLGYLLDKLEAADLEDKVNLILLSDHGMVDVDFSRVVEITRWINLTDLTWSASGAVGHIVPKPGLEHKVYGALKNAHSNMKVYWRDEVPQEFHFRYNERIPPIVALADEGWYIIAGTNFTLKGGHGYDNSLDSMKSLLVASGPDFKKGYSMAEMHVLDVYPLMCHILHIMPETHEGNFERISCLLKNSDNCDVSHAARLSRSFWLPLLIASVAALFTVRSRSSNIE